MNIPGISPTQPSAVQSPATSGKLFPTLSTASAELARHATKYKVGGSYLGQLYSHMLTRATATLGGIAAGLGSLGIARLFGASLETTAQISLGTGLFASIALIPPAFKLVGARFLKVVPKI